MQQNDYRCVFIIRYARLRRVLNLKLTPVDIDVSGVAAVTSHCKHDNLTGIFRITQLEPLYLAGSSFG